MLTLIYFSFQTFASFLTEIYMELTLNLLKTSRVGYSVKDKKVN